MSQIENVQNTNNERVTPKAVDLKSTAKGKVVIQEGEEKLHQHYNVSNVNGRKRLLISVDGGSTQTRDLIIDNLEEPDTELYTIPSTLSFISKDLVIRSQGDNLYDHMDSYITNLASSAETIFAKERVIRGNKKVDFNGAEERISSTTQKISSKTFYINIIDAIGYALVQKYEEIPSEIDVILGVALPPDDRSSQVNLDKFTSIINNSFIWANRDLGLKVTINIIENLVLTEPEAFMLASNTTEREGEVPEVELHINAGGRSIGIELLENGRAIDAASKPLAYGGAPLLEDLGNLISKSEGGRKPSNKALSEAVKTGLLKVGNTTKDITKYIKTVKRQYADRIYNDVVKEVFDVQREITLNDVNIISISGGTFSAGTCDISVAKYLEENFKSTAPNTNFVYINWNYIPLGLAFSLFNEYGGFLEEVAFESYENRDIATDLTEE